MRKEPTSLALRLDDGMCVILNDSRFPDANVGSRHDLGVDYTFEKKVRLKAKIAGKKGVTYPE